jgi:hypothetical protein
VDVVKNIAVVLGIIFLIILIPYLLAEGWKGFSLGTKAWGLWILGYLGLALMGGLILFLLIFGLRGC